MCKILLLFIFINISIKPIVLSQDSLETFHHNYYAPCFGTSHPKVIQTPAKLGLKNNDYYAFLGVEYFFDSLGNTLDIVPSVLRIRDKTSNRVIEEYYYSKYIDDIQKSMSKKRAKKFAKWAIKNLPLYTNIYRYPPNVRCNEKVTNRNAYSFDYRLE